MGLCGRVLGASVFLGLIGALIGRAFGAERIDLIRCAYRAVNGVCNHRAHSIHTVSQDAQSKGSTKAFRSVPARLRTAQRPPPTVQRWQRSRCSRSKATTTTTRGAAHTQNAHTCGRGRSEKGLTATGRFDPPPKRQVPTSLARLGKPTGRRTNNARCRSYCNPPRNP